MIWYIKDKKSLFFSKSFFFWKKSPISVSFTSLLLNITTLAKNYFLRRRVLEYKQQQKQQCSSKLKKPTLLIHTDGTIFVVTVVFRVGFPACRRRGVRRVLRCDRRHSSSNSYSTVVVGGGGFALACGSSLFRSVRWWLGVRRCRWWRADHKRRR